MQYSKLTGAEKCAVLLFCLGEEASAKVFEELDDSEVRQISRTMLNIEHVPPEVAQKVLDEYKKCSQEFSGIFVHGREFVEKSFAETDEKKRFSNFLDNLDTGPESRALETIANMQPKMVAMLLQSEHPQTLALILSTQKVDHAGKILANYHLELKTDVMYRMAKLENVSDELIGLIEDVLQREIGIAVSRGRQHVGGVDKVTDIIGSMENGMGLLNTLEEVDPELTEVIRRKLFTFEDLILVDDKSMQTILKEVSSDTLTLALKTSSEELEEKIFRNISNRAAEMIKEDLEVMGPRKLSDVENVQLEIVKIALRLDDEGTIALPNRGGNDVLV